MKEDIDNLLCSFKKGLISKEHFSGELAEIVAYVNKSDIKEKFYHWMLSKLN